MRAKVVIGSAFGDEGKGMAVDALASTVKKPMVVRFNGGCQAGHTVQTPAGNRHVFHHIGAGAFAGAATFLSRHFLVNPAVFLKEMHDVSRIITCPQVFVNPRAHVTTPYDIMLNRWAEQDRGDGRHGSCGEGIGETVDRGLSGVVIYAEDLFGDPLRLERLLKSVSDYALDRAARLNIRMDEGRADMIRGKKAASSFLASVALLRGKMKLADTSILNDYDVIFEGAQGLLLDQNNKDMFPHLTRSNTGLKNVAEICWDTEISEVDVFYMMRPYFTRHGAGPLPNERDISRFATVYDPTNQPNDWQGTLRFAPIDLDLVGGMIAADCLRGAGAGLGIRPMVGVSCLDQIKAPIDVYASGLHQILFPTEFIPNVEEALQMNVMLEGWGPTRTTAKIKAKVPA